jgi:septal ring factor EnvC (AmiA/AmiB activator)
VNVELLIALGGIIAGPLLAYILAARKLSGKIGTSEASELWSESRSIRDDYRDRITNAEDRSRGLELRVAKLEEMNNNLVRENLVLQNTVSEFTTTIADLRKRIDFLEKENAELRKLLIEEKAK